jgi:integrase
VDITRRFLGDEASEGINPHAFRHIIATDAIRKDLLQGFAIAAKLLKNTVKTVERSYAHLRADDRTKFINSTIDAKLSEALAELGAADGTKYLVA